MTICTLLDALFSDGAAGAYIYASIEALLKLCPGVTNRVTYGIGNLKKKEAVSAGRNLTNLHSRKVLLLSNFVVEDYEGTV